MKFIKKMFLISLFIILLFFSFSFKVDAKEVNVYFFHGKTCPHCEEASEYLNSIKDKYDLNIIKYEVWYNEDNKEIMNDIADYLDFNVRGVPFVIIDNTPITGYSSGVTDETYKYHIKLASKDSFVDKVGMELGVVDKEIYDEKTSSKNNDFKIDFLIFKDINLKVLSPFISSLILGLKDGVNICSLCVLLILIFAVGNLKDRRKILTLGIIYMIVLSIGHLMLILSPLDFARLINLITALKVIIPFLIVIVGALKINFFINYLDNTKNETKSKIKNYFQRKSLIFMIISTIILGVFSVLIGFNYSTGSSQLFISLIDNLNNISYLLCILIYIIGFILFSFVVYFVLSWLIIILNKTKWFNKYSKLVSGVLLLLIGILLLLKPELFIIGI